MAECPICREAIETARVVTSCNHVFHMTCLTQWYATNHKQTCPMCREEAKGSNRAHTTGVDLTNDMVNDFVVQAMGQLSIIDILNSV